MCLNFVLALREEAVSSMKCVAGIDGKKHTKIRLNGGGGTTTKKKHRERAKRNTGATEN